MRFPINLKTLGAAALATAICQTSAVATEPLQPIEVVPQPLEKAALGKLLFSEPRLSHDDTVSCASCHSLESSGADTSRVSLGVSDREGHVNTPTVFNAQFNFRQFWDGRAATLEEQIDGPIHADMEMNTTWQEIVGKLSDDFIYQARFNALYDGEISADTIKDAIATFERTLVTPSRFDDYLKGNELAITSDEKNGYALFKAYGCAGCHQGRNVGGNMYQYFGVMGNYFEDRGNITKADLGRFNVTGKEQDKFMFRVPSLRNVGVTAPYFHDGTAATLEDAVDTMVKYQLGRPVPKEDRGLIVTFLRSLTGKTVKQTTLSDSDDQVATTGKDAQLR